MTRLRPAATAALLVLLAAATAAAQAPDGRAQRGALVRAAEQQVGVTLIYDPAYARMAYPGGDVPLDRGVCSDVVVRAFRGIGVDLQRLVHEDMAQHFAAYPRLWQLRAPDPNIDHRRVPNLMKYFERRGKKLPRDAAYEPGDIVVWRLTNGLLHIGVLSDRRTAAGHPLVIHNIGSGPQIEDILFGYEHVARYRW